MSSEEFKAIANYAPVHGDEIKLTVGDRVTLLHSYDDGKLIQFVLLTNHALLFCLQAGYWVETSHQMQLVSYLKTF